MQTLPLTPTGRGGVEAARRWYANSGRRTWQRVERLHHRDNPEYNLPRVICERLELDPSNVTWQQNGQRLEVTPEFVRRVVQWQVWRRWGLGADGRLGQTGITAMGIETGERAPGLTLSAADLPAGREPQPDPRLIEFFREDTFAARLLQILTGGGRRGRTTDVAGAAAPTVGIAAATSVRLPPRRFVEEMFREAPQLVLRTFFGDETEGRGRDDVLAALGLGAAPEEGDVTLAALVSREAFGRFMALLRTEEAIQLQLRLFQQTVEETEASVREQAEGERPTNGMMVMGTLFGTFGAPDPARELEIQGLQRYVRARISEAPVAEAAASYVERLVIHHLEGGDRPAWNSEQSEELPDDPPPAAQYVNQVLGQFAAAWDDPYDPDCPLRVPMAGAAGGSARLAPGEAEMRPVPAGIMSQATDPSRPWGAHAEVYEERVSQGRLRVTGVEFPPTWQEYLAQMREMTFLRHRVVGHMAFLRRLDIAQRWLRANHPEVRESAWIRGVGDPGARTQWRAGERTASPHVFGMAIDINSQASPWLHATPSRSDAERRRQTLQRNTCYAWIIWRACWLTGRGRPFSPAEVHRMAGRRSSASPQFEEVEAPGEGETENTRALWNYFNEMNQAVLDYLRLAGNRSAVAARLQEMEQAGRGPPPNPEGAYIEGYVPAQVPRQNLESRSLDAWMQVLEWDAGHWPNVLRQPGETQHLGIMDLRLELVVALRDIAGLQWGGSDLGPRALGDMMHFALDPRTFYLFRNDVRERQQEGR